MRQFQSPLQATKILRQLYKADSGSALHLAFRSLKYSQVASSCDDTMDTSRGGVDKLGTRLPTPRDLLAQRIKTEKDNFGINIW
jgi:hypothetical protein